MFIILDTDDLDYVDSVVEYLRSQVSEPVVFRANEDDSADGERHVVWTAREFSRWESLMLARRGARLWSDTVTDESPIYAGGLPSPEKFRRILVDAQNADSRAEYFDTFEVHYLGRTKLNPRNMFILDNKKDNPFHNPDNDPSLEALYASLPDDWWGSCGFVSSSNIQRLEAFLESFAGDTIFLAYTTGAFSKLKFMGFDYVDTGVPKATQEFGIMVRDKANRLSYKLAQPEVPQAPIDPTGFKYVL